MSLFETDTVWRERSSAKVPDVFVCLFFLFYWEAVIASRCDSECALSYAKDLQVELLELVQRNIERNVGLINGHGCARIETNRVMRCVK